MHSICNIKPDLLIAFWQRISRNRKRLDCVDLLSWQGSTAQHADDLRKYCPMSNSIWCEYLFLWLFFNRLIAFENTPNISAYVESEVKPEKGLLFKKIFRREVKSTFHDNDFSKCGKGEAGSWEVKLYFLRYEVFGISHWKALILRSRVWPSAQWAWWKVVFFELRFLHLYVIGIGGRVSIGLAEVEFQVERLSAWRWALPWSACGAALLPGALSHRVRSPHPPRVHLPEASRRHSVVAKQARVVRYCAGVEGCYREKRGTWLVSVVKMMRHVLCGSRVLSEGHAQKRRSNPNLDALFHMRRGSVLTYDVEFG